MDTLSGRDQFAVVKRLVMITAMKSEDVDDYLWALTDVVTDDIRAHLSKTADSAGQPGARPGEPDNWITLKPVPAR